MSKFVEVLPWEKVGDPTTLAGKYGKKLVLQKYKNPHTGEEEDFVLFGQKDWSVVLAITTDGYVLAVRQYKQGCDKIILELPAGTADFDSSGPEETPESIMRRELREETGYAAGEVVSLGAYWIASRSSWTRFHCFLATKCQEVGEPTRNPKEPLTRHFLPLQEWIRMTLIDGIIDEPSAVVATARSLAPLGFLKLD